MGPVVVVVGLLGFVSLVGSLTGSLTGALSAARTLSAAGALSATGALSAAGTLSGAGALAGAGAVSITGFVSAAFELFISVCFAFASTFACTFEVAGALSDDVGAFSGALSVALSDDVGAFSGALSGTFSAALGAVSGTLSATDTLSAFPTPLSTADIAVAACGTPMRDAACAPPAGRS